MSSGLWDRYRELQAYVGWCDEDAARVRSVAAALEDHMDALVEDFYAEIQRHPEALQVITGGQAQIERLKISLRAWLQDSLQGRGDADYVERRWRIGLRHAEIGLNPAFTSAAMARLRNGIIDFLATRSDRPPADLRRLEKSFNKLLDLDLSIIHDAYQFERLRRKSLPSTSEVKRSSAS